MQLHLQLCYYYIINYTQGQLYLFLPAGGYNKNFWKVNVHLQYKMKLYHKDSDINYTIGLAVIF
jgi:hypothetical protein